MAAIVIAIPHSATALPPELKGAFLDHVDGAFLRTQSDAFTDQIYDLPGVRSERFHWSRVVADPNRAELQRTEGGVVPVTDFAERPLYAKGQEPDNKEKRRRVREYHAPYHARVAELVDDPATRFFIDGHSMAGTAPVRSPDYGTPRPDAVLSNRGNARGNPTPGAPFLTCPPDLTRHLAKRLHHWLGAIPAPDVSPKARRPTAEVTINVPFKGGYGVRMHAALQGGRPGLQLELNQALWTDETDWLPWPERVAWMREVMSRWLDDLVVALDRHEQRSA